MLNSAGSHKCDTSLRNKCKCPYKKGISCKDKKEECPSPPPVEWDTNKNNDHILEGKELLKCKWGKKQ